MNKRLALNITMILSVVLGTVLFVVLAGGFTWYAIIVVTIAALFLIFGISKMIKYKNDIVSDDEYSKKVLRLASSRSFMISLYVWLFIMVFSKVIDDYVDSITKIGIGMVLMGLVFLINMIIIKLRGIRE
jgi:peptidoglycan/LPS O-acetylase OafA/YrhL